MVDNDSSRLAAAVGAFAEHRRQEQGAHLTADQLHAYHDGQLTETEAEQVRDHLELCPECSCELLGLEADADTELSAAAFVTDEQLDADFAKVRDRLVANGTLKPQGTVTRFPDATGAKSPARVPWTIAAALLICVVGLASWLVLQGPGRPGGPLGNVRIIDLVPIGEGIERSIQGPEATTFPAGTPSAVLILNLTNVESYERYSAEVSRVGQPPIHLQINDLRRSEEGNFTISLPRDSVPAGDYRIVLRGERDGTTADIAEYLAPISYETPGD